MPILLLLVLLFTATCTTVLTVSSTSLSYANNAKICDITTYGNASYTDIGPSLSKAFAACVTVAGRNITQQVVLYVPDGTYQLQYSILLQNGMNWMLHLDGATIYAGAGVTDNVIYIEGGSWFTLSGESSKSGLASKRATINAQAWLYNSSQGASNNWGSNFHQLLRLSNVDQAVVGRLNLVACSNFYLGIVHCTNTEVFDVLINGPAHGNTDGMDVSGDNIWIHDVQVHNGDGSTGDECVTLKSPATNILVERVYCNGSVGTQIGSFDTPATASQHVPINVQNITYRNIYSANCNTGFTVKACVTSTGVVKNITLTNFILNSVGVPFSLNYFYTTCASLPEGMEAGAGNLTMSDITISNWTGTSRFTGLNHPIIGLECGKSGLDLGGPNHPTCTNINFVDFNIWNPHSATAYAVCQNAVGSGAACLVSADSFTVNNTNPVQVPYTTTVGTIPSPTWGLIQVPLTVYPVYPDTPTIVFGPAATTATPTPTQTLTAMPTQTTTPKPTTTAPSSTPTSTPTSTLVPTTVATVKPTAAPTGASTPTSTPSKLDSSSSSGSGSASASSPDFSSSSSFDTTHVSLVANTACLHPAVMLVAVTTAFHVAARLSHLV